MEGSTTTIELEATKKAIREYYTIDKDMKATVSKGDNVEAKQIIAKMAGSRQKVQALHAGRVTNVTDDIIVIEDLVPERVSYDIAAGRHLTVSK